MASNNNSNRLLNQNVGEVGVTLNQGYNGDLTSRQAGSIGGQMVRKMCPVRTMTFDRASRISAGYANRFTYRARVVV